MSRRALVLTLAIGLSTGCLNKVLPNAPDAGSVEQPVATGAVPDLGQTFAADPLGDGGQPVGFKDIQASLDSLGCTTAACHGGTQSPVVTAKPPNLAVAMTNFNDFTTGCNEGAPDPSDCIDLTQPENSLELSKPLATSSVTHMGGKPFKDANDPVYQQWRAWIAAGAPY
jgi:hypothetical protein